MAKAEVVVERTLADAEAELAAAKNDLAELELLAIDPEHKGLLVSVLRDAVAGPGIGCPNQVAALNDYISRWSE